MSWKRWRLRGSCRSMSPHGGEDVHCSVKGSQVHPGNHFDTSVPLPPRVILEPYTGPFQRMRKKPTVSPGREARERKFHARQKSAQCKKRLTSPRILETRRERILAKSSSCNLSRSKAVAASCFFFVLWRLIKFAALVQNDVRLGKDGPSVVVPQRVTTWRRGHSL